MKAFVTGSRKYGVPTEKSDIDLIVFLECEDEYDMLVQLADDQHRVTCWEEYEGLALPPIRFGNLNLICCINELEYECWRDGTSQLESKKPVTRDVAVELLHNLRIERGVRKK